MNWYRSLYARVAVGFVLFLAAMLVVQALLFVWVMAQSGRTLQGESPNHAAQRIAIDVAGAVAVDPTLNLDRYIRDQYAQFDHPFFIMLQNGTVIASGGTPAESSLETARAFLRRRPRAEEARQYRGDRAQARRGDPLGGDSRAQTVRPMPIMINESVAGVVFVPAQAPFSSLLRRFAPSLMLVATGVLIVGTALTAVLIFGPPRRRLHGLEAAARRLGGGDLSARAPDRGGDEVASVARAFNAMADELATSDRVRRQLLADVSHELNTPVTAMRGYLETLTMPDMALDDATRLRYLGIIGDEIARLEHIIGDLLDLARLEGGGGSLTIEPVEVSQLFERVAARHERSFQTAGVVLCRTVEPGAGIVAGDRGRLEQAVQNLAANASRYAPPDSTIRLTARTDGRTVTISVEDEGPGILKEHLPRIFDRFYKADSARTARQPVRGSGLGLSIVKAIVERHGGRVSVTTRPGRTIFEMAGLARAGALNL